MLGLARFRGFAGFADSPCASRSSLRQVRDGIALLAFFFLELLFIFTPFLLLFFLLSLFFFFCFFFSSFFASFRYPRLGGNGRWGLEVDSGLPGAK